LPGTRDRVAEWFGAWRAISIGSSGITETGRCHPAISQLPSVATTLSCIYAESPGDDPAYMLERWQTGNYKLQRRCEQDWQLLHCGDRIMLRSFAIGIERRTFVLYNNGRKVPKRC
jgi:hypothetical protein